MQALKIELMKYFLYQLTLYSLESLDLTIKAGAMDPYILKSRFIRRFYVQYVLASGAVPQTPRGELTAPPSCWCWERDPPPHHIGHPPRAIPASAPATRTRSSMVFKKL